jgi:ATPase subunit of ABC transporter with duplicated ATPase domains
VAQYVPDDDLSLTLYDMVQKALPPEQAAYESWRVDVVLDDLSVPYDLQQTPLASLSGGWQRTGMLAAAWITQPDVLLLNEPTNHLDLHRIGLLESWLRALPRDVAVFITSHDRAFLDAVSTRTLFLRADTSRDFPLPFSAARDALDEADAADARRFANGLNKASQLRKQAAKLKDIGINSRSDLLANKTKQLTERAAKIEAAAKPAHRETGAGDIKLGNAGTHAKALVAFPDVQVQTPNGRDQYKSGEKWITPGDRIILLGANGTGKTQLVQMVHRALTCDDGPLKCAPSVTLGYSDQHLSQLNPDETPMQTIAGQFDVGDQHARGLLAGAGVNIQMQDTALSKLSG